MLSETGLGASAWLMLLLSSAFDFYVPSFFLSLSLSLFHSFLFPFRSGQARVSRGFWAMCINGIVIVHYIKMREGIDAAALLIRYVSLPECVFGWSWDLKELSSCPFSRSQSRELVPQEGKRKEG